MCSAEGTPRVTWRFALLLAVELAAFLLGVGLLCFAPNGHFSDAVAGRLGIGALLSVLGVWVRRRGDA